MSPLYLLRRALEFPNGDLFIQWKKMENGEEQQCLFHQEVSGMAYWNNVRILLGEKRILKGELR